MTRDPIHLATHSRIYTIPPPVPIGFKRPIVRYPTIRMRQMPARACVWLDPWYQPCYPYSLARSRSLSFKGSLETHVPMVGGSVSLAMITSSIKCTFKRSIVYMVQPRQSHLSTQPRARVRVRVYVISLVICHITISRAPWYVPHGLSIKRASDLSISCWPQLSLALFLTLLITNASSNKPIHLHLFDRIRMRGCSLHLSATSQA